MITETLKKRLELAEQKLSPKKPLIDLIQVVKDIRIESERLMNLSQSDYEMELSMNPTSKANRAARSSVAYEKLTQAIQLEADRLLTLSPNQYQIEMGQPNNAATPDEWWIINESRKLAHEAKMHPKPPETLKMEEEEKQRLTSPNNWVSAMMKDRAKTTIHPRKPK